MPRDFDTSQLDATVAAGVGPGGVIPGRLAAVVAPELGVHWQGAAGVSNRETGDPLRPDDAVRLSTVTRTYTAATVLRLVEKRAFEIDAPIHGLLAPETLAVLAGSGYDVDAITIRHLLTHTSGLPDYRFGAGETATSSPYIAKAAENLAYKWTRLEQVQWGLSHYSRVGAPGEKFSVSDTGYLLLGEIVERITGMSLGDAAEFQLDYDGLGMIRTWWEVDEAQPAGTRRAHQERGPDDTYDYDATYDLYGAGGVTSTMADLVKFFDALLGGKVFTEPATLETMLTIPDSNAEAGYAMGIQRQDVDGRECWGQDGLTGVAVVSCPAEHVTVAVSINDEAPEDPAISARADIAALMALVG